MEYKKKKKKKIEFQLPCCKLTFENVSRVESCIVTLKHNNLHKPKRLLRTGNHLSVLFFKIKNKIYLNRFNTEIVLRIQLSPIMLDVKEIYKLKTTSLWSSLVVQQVKDPMWHCCGSDRCCGIDFDSWLQFFHIQRDWPKKPQKP